VFVSLPALRVHWEGYDPDGPGGLPVEYKYLLLGPGSEFPVSQALVAPDSLRRYYAHHPLGPWAGWDSTGSDSPSAAFANLIPNEQYVFVVIAFDQAGDYSPVFSLSSNMLRFTVSFMGYQGPVITLTGPGLDYRYPSGGYCPCQSAEVPVEIPERRPTTFGWSAQAFTACDTDSVAWYRWALDIDDVTDQTPRTNEQTDLRHWSTPSPETRSAPLPPFVLANPPAPELHRLTIEAQDKVGVRSLGIIRITVVPSTNGPPDCRAAVADPQMLWPPNHRFVRVNIRGVSDPDGDPVTIQVTRVTQDEPISDRRSDDWLAASEPSGDEADDAASVEGSGQHLGDDHSGEGHGDERRGCADAIIDPDGGLRLRAERDGRGNGRVYTIGFTASDGHGNTCDGSVQVCVPRDRRHPACVNDGRSFNSLGPCRGRRHDDVLSTMLEVASESSIRGANVATLDYSLPATGDVLVAVYDVTGRRVTTLVNENQTAGAHQMVWNHAGVAQGMYFVRMWTRSVSLTRSILILR
jgi:hypothetical protein